MSSSSGSGTITAGREGQRTTVFVGHDLPSERDNRDILVLPNPSQRTILWAMRNVPFDPRWSATLELPGRKTAKSGSRTPLAEAAIRQEFGGGLSVQASTIFIEPNEDPEQELLIIQGRRPYGRLIFPDSGTSESERYAGFRDKLLPGLIASGYEVASAKLVNYFTGYGNIDDSTSTSIKSGIVIDRRAIRMYVSDLSEQRVYASVLPRAEGMQWFDRLQTETQAE